ncbi:hypothetical protein [Conexibacter sp. CPCC 206217]|uniref:hypothetical protein n=1 Tax=Conexibacter sp. CPCC 206217 TaxID=3064574 RepID=UPI00271CF4F8|nr:hypothetical protein [Conexibacter sp. CPCC 206217]MDO8213911.1 hypothetical protein [Conexibacter sp. CPCC 206217]
MSPADRAPVRSYQRIFKPDRRVFAVEGHRIPVPGGVPLRWLGYAALALLAVLLLAARSPLLSVLLGLGVAATALALGSRSTAAVAAVATFGATQVIGYMLATLDWPLRLLVLPAVVATFATQATPDGRAAHRFARSWIAAQLRPERRTLSRPLLDTTPGELAGVVAVAPDAHGPELRRGRVLGPALVRFARPVALRERRGGRRGVRRVRGQLGGRRSRAVVRVELGAGERLEVRP